ncbi:MAG: aldo-keto reductase family protein [Planctomycetota bacterium]|jgi:hypothetical protein
MADFPRAEIGGVSVSRLVIGTNWFLGYTHCTRAKSRSTVRLVTSCESIAEIITVFLKAGVDTIYLPHTKTCLPDAMKRAEDAAGRGLVKISTPSFPTDRRTALDGFNLDEVARVLDDERSRGTDICMPHTSTTDLMVDKCAREVRQMAPVCAMMRERGMVPGLSTHMPESIVIADESGLDVETYAQPFNSRGFLMHIEVDWAADIIHRAKRPVIAIKPMAAGQVRPFEAMTFVWNAVRERDVVCAGTMAPEEAEELVDLSRDILERRHSTVELQATRSKATVTGEKKDA